MSPLERRYRRLLFAYPAAYRHDRCDELVATLVELGVPGQQWPSVAEALHLLGHASRLRARRHVGGASNGEVWADGARLAGAVALLLLSAIGLTVAWRCGLSLAAGRHRALLGNKGMRLAGHGDALVLPVLLCALSWPAAFLFSLHDRRWAAAGVATFGAAGSATLLLAERVVFAQRPALDLIGALAGLAVLATPPLIAGARAQHPGVLANAPRRWMELALGMLVVAGLMTAGRSVGAPGPWLHAGPATGLRLSAIGGVAVGAWLLADVMCVPLARRSARTPAAVCVAAVVPLFAGLGYCLNSATLSAHAVPALLMSRAPVVAVAVVLLGVPLLMTLLARPPAATGRA